MCHLWVREQGEGIRSSQGDVSAGRQSGFSQRWFFCQHKTQEGRAGARSQTVMLRKRRETMLSERRSAFLQGANFPAQNTDKCYMLFGYKEKKGRKKRKEKTKIKEIFFKKEEKKEKKKSGQVAVTLENPHSS